MRKKKMKNNVITSANVIEWLKTPNSQELANIDADIKKKDNDSIKSAVSAYR